MRNGFGRLLTCCGAWTMTVVVATSMVDVVVPG